MSKLEIKLLPDEIQLGLPPDVSASISAQILQHIPDAELKFLTKKSKRRKLEDRFPQLTPEYICEGQAAIKYGLSASWFRNHRWKGTGPTFKKFDRAVRYEVKTLDEYMSSLDI
jgi:hypothetical protein